MRLRVSYPDLILLTKESSAHMWYFVIHQLVAFNQTSPASIDRHVNSYQTKGSSSVLQFLGKIESKTVMKVFNHIDMTYDFLGRLETQNQHPEFQKFIRHVCLNSPRHWILSMITSLRARVSHLQAHRIPLTEQDLFEPTSSLSCDEFYRLQLERLQTMETVGRSATISAMDVEALLLTFASMQCEMPRHGGSLLAHSVMKATFESLSLVIGSTSVTALKCFAWVQAMTRLQQDCWLEKVTTFDVTMRRVWIALHHCMSTIHAIKGKQDHEVDRDLIAEFRKEKMGIVASLLQDAFTTTTKHVQDEECHSEYLQYANLSDSASLNSMSHMFVVCLALLSHKFVFLLPVERMLRTVRGVKPCKRVDFDGMRQFDSICDDMMRTLTEVLESRRTAWLTKVNHDRPVSRGCKSLDKRLHHSRDQGVREWATVLREHCKFRRYFVGRKAKDIADFRAQVSKHTRQVDQGRMTVYPKFDDNGRVCAESVHRMFRIHAQTFACRDPFGFLIFGSIDGMSRGPGKDTEYMIKTMLYLSTTILTPIETGSRYHTLNLDDSSQSHTDNMRDCEVLACCIMHMLCNGYNASITLSSALIRSAFDIFSDPKEIFLDFVTECAIDSRGIINMLCDPGLDQSTVVDILDGDEGDNIGRLVEAHAKRVIERTSPMNEGGLNIMRKAFKRIMEGESPELRWSIDDIGYTAIQNMLKPISITADFIEFTIANMVSTNKLGSNTFELFKVILRDIDGSLAPSVVKGPAAFRKFFEALMMFWTGSTTPTAMLEVGYNQSSLPSSRTCFNLIMLPYRVAELNQWKYERPVEVLYKLLMISTSYGAMHTTL